MGTTAKANMIFPPLYAEAVEGAFASQDAFTSAKAKALGIVRIDGTFPQAGNNVIGSTVKVPYFNSLGEFVARTDGTPATATTFSASEETGTVTCGTLGFDLTTWANSTPMPGASPYEEAARQVMRASERYMDSLIIAELAKTTNNALVLDRYSATTPRNLDYDMLTDGVGLWSDFADLDELAAVIVHGKVYNDLLKVKDGMGNPMLIGDGEVGGMKVRTLKHWGTPLIVSDRMPKSDSVLTAVTALGSLVPTITVANSTNREGGTGPVRPIDVRLYVTTVGARGTWKFKLSIDGGATYTADDYYTSAATVALTDPLDPAGGLLGVTLTIGTGTTLATTEGASFKSTMKHTSLIVKKNCAAFWFNAQYAGVLQQVPVPLNDSVISASHLYGVAHRYSRLPGQPYPGVVVIRHNGGGL